MLQKNGMQLIPRHFRTFTHVKHIQCFKQARCLMFFRWTDRSLALRHFAVLMDRKIRIQNESRIYYEFDVEVFCQEMTIIKKMWIIDSGFQVVDEIFRFSYWETRKRTHYFDISFLVREFSEYVVEVMNHIYLCVTGFSGQKNIKIIHNFCLLLWI